MHDARRREGISEEACKARLRARPQIQSPMLLGVRRSLSERNVRGRRGVVEASRSARGLRALLHGGVQRGRDIRRLYVKAKGIRRWQITSRGRGPTISACGI